MLAICGGETSDCPRLGSSLVGLHWLWHINIDLSTPYKFSLATLDIVYLRT